MRLMSSFAISSEASRDQPSAVLKATTLTGLENCPSSSSRMTLSRLERWFPRRLVAQ
jgi:hypothetical protein